MTFFFSSRRRHTRWTGDWSSDVCSSDLHRLTSPSAAARTAIFIASPRLAGQEGLDGGVGRLEHRGHRTERRSEERRVGKEWREGGCEGGLNRQGRRSVESVCGDGEGVWT